MSQPEGNVGQPGHARVSGQMLSYIHDILFALRQPYETSFPSQVTGTVTRVTSRKGVIFVIIRDATGHMQLKFSEDVLLGHDWQLARGIRKADRVRVVGLAGTNPFRQQPVPTLFVQSVESLPPTPFTEKELAAPEDEAITSEFFLARIRSKAAEYFLKHDYEEFEPSYMSSSAGPSRVRALRVLFPGFGAPAFMAPSPAARLVQVVFSSPTSKVFCTSRCFSNEIRDGYTSAESLALFACQLNVDLDQLTRIATDSIRFIFSDIATAPDLEASKTTWVSDAPWAVDECNWTNASMHVSSPTVQVLPAPADAGREHLKLKSVFRVLWPEDRVLVEGHIGLIDSTLAIGAFSLHLERMLPVLRDVILRRLRH